MYKRILIATDGSRLAGKAVNAGIGLARAVGARVTLFHAAEAFPVMPSPEFAIASGRAGVAAWDKARKKRAERVLAKARARAKLAGLACETRFAVAASPHKAILEAARRDRCDLIVMASHGRRGLEGLVLGSVTQKVLTLGKLPVLVCR